jgi:hypothetical protein
MDMFTLSNTGNSVSDTIASLPSGHTDTITITVTINSNVANGSQISNTAMVSSNTSDPNPNNNSSTSTLTVNSRGTRGAQLGQGKPLSYYAGLLGQQLISSARHTSGGQTLAQWLATSFPNLFGGSNGAANLSGLTNSQVAMYFETLYHGTTLPRWGAEIMAVALDVYFTTFSLGGTLGQLYGFRVDAAGLGACTWNIDSSGFGVPNGTVLTVFQILLAANNAAVGGDPWANNLVQHNQLMQIFSDINSEW